MKKERIITDELSRSLRDLRISVTDRCNFRCSYCMPKEIFHAGYRFLARDEVLTFEEIVRSVGIFVALGVKKIRITGGEPLLRKDVEKLIEQLACIEGIEDISLTTNGSLVTLAKARRLKDAGLKRITISLDSLDDKVFHVLNGVGFSTRQVLAGIDNASAAGLIVKINMVVKKRVNDQDILPLARRFHNTPHILRFIEYMDVGTTNRWELDDVVVAEDIIRRIDEAMPVEPIAANYPGEVARRWRYRDGGGEIGVIASVSQPFCRSCTRLRLSADGHLYTCLFAARGHDLKSLLRKNTSDELIMEWLRQIWNKRSDRYSEIRSVHTVDFPKVEMSYVGG